MIAGSVWIRCPDRLTPATEFRLRFKRFIGSPSISLSISSSISSLSSPEKHNSISAVVQAGYAVGYGFNKAEAYGKAVRNTPTGVISYPAQFIKIGPNKYKCIIRWEKK